MTYTKLMDTNEPMTPLSPAAQATYDAFNRVGLYNEPSFETDRKALAAALRAAADIATPIECEKLWKDGRMEEYDVESNARKKLLALAAELEGQF